MNSRLWHKKLYGTLLIGLYLFAVIWPQCWWHKIPTSITIYFHISDNIDWCVHWKDIFSLPRISQPRRRSTCCSYCGLCKKVLKYLNVIKKKLQYLHCHDSASPNSTLMRPVMLLWRSRINKTRQETLLVCFCLDVNDDYRFSSLLWQFRFLQASLAVDVWQQSEYTCITDSKVNTRYHLPIPPTPFTQAMVLRLPTPNRKTK